MLKFFSTRLLAGILAAVSFLSLLGCTDSNVKSYNSTVSIKINDSEYYLSKLSDIEKKFFCIDVTLTSNEQEELNKPYKLKLNDVNDFSDIEYVKPGSYTIKQFDISAGFDLPFNIDDIKGTVISVQLGKNVDVNLQANERPFTQPLNEILDSPKFSNKIQVKGILYDIEYIQESLSFDFDHAVDKKAECTDVEGLYLLFDGSGEKRTITGLEFTSDVCFLWGGMTIGSSISSITNEKNGTIGVPSYGEGSPILKYDCTDTSFTFINPDNGRIIEIGLYSGLTTVKSIKYLFGKEEIK